MIASPKKEADEDRVDVILVKNLEGNTGKLVEHLNRVTGKIHSATSE